MLLGYFTAKARGVFRYFATIFQVMFLTATLGRSLQVLTPLVMQRGLDFFFTCLALGIASGSLMTRIFAPEINVDEYAEQFYRISVLLLSSIIGGLALKLVKPGTKWTHYLVCLAYIHGITFIIVAVSQISLSFIFLWAGPDAATLGVRFTDILLNDPKAFQQNGHPCWLATPDTLFLPCRLYLAGGEFWGRIGEWMAAVWAIFGGLLITKHALGIKRRYIVLAPFLAISIVGIPGALLFHWYRRRRQNRRMASPRPQMAQQMPPMAPRMPQQAAGGRRQYPLR